MKNIIQTIEKETGYAPQSPEKIYRANRESRVKYWFSGILIFLSVLLFMPWTQNINASGTVTTLYQDQRPQEINAIIPGRIIKWWVKEGDMVKKGDTLVQLADVKDDYLDPQLLERTEEQILSKEQKIGFYAEKINATENQVLALEQSRNFKLNALENKMQQLRRKVVSDSAELTAAEIDLGIATLQYNRAKQMFSEGIIALTELERRTAQYNKMQASVTEKQQKLLNTRQDITITGIDMLGVSQDAADKIFKAKSEIAGARSEMASTGGDLAKQNNQLANYAIRGSQRWLIAPQDGQLINAKKQGLNEMVKEGETIAEIVPSQTDLAVELFVAPQDLVLVSKGQPVRLIFDGFPAIVFSGWPAASYGTFLGEVIAVETNVNVNGKFRMLVVPGKNEKHWPEHVRFGAGVKGFAMLKNVSIWYELWRQVNGFPPEYYLPAPAPKDKKK